MEKSRILRTTLIIMTICLIFFINTKVFATEVPEEGINPISETTPNAIDDIEATSEPIVNEAITGDNTQANLENNESNNNQENENHNIHEGDLYIAADRNNYVMDQMVDGNVFIVGKNIKITGEINGSLFIFASGTVEIEKDAYIACHVFAFANDIALNGMALDFYSASRKFELGADALIYREIKAVANNIYLSGTVGRDASFHAEKIEISDEENALKIYGNLNYEAKNEISNLEKANIDGEVIFKQLSENKEETIDIIFDYIFGAIGTIVFDIILYIGLLFLAPKFVEKTKEYVSTRGLLAFAIGLAFIVIVPIIAFALLLTGVLAGLSAFIILSYSVILMMNAFIIALVANEFISSKLNIDDKIKKGLLLIPVSLVIWLLRKIPILGSWISIIVCLCGIGVIILYQFDRRKDK